MIKESNRLNKASENEKLMMQEIPRLMFKC